MSTPLIDAVYRCDRRKVADLLRRGADPNEKDPFTIHRPLLCAIETGDLAIFDQLLAAGADFRKFPRMFLWALQWGRVEMVKRLLAAGANPNAVECSHGVKPKPALQFARECRDKKVAAELMILLIEAGARVDNPAKKLAELRRRGLRDRGAERLAKLNKQVRF